jgi:transcriptional regulator NrdR family protein
MVVRDYYRDPWALRCPECAGRERKMTACNIVKGGVVREYECQDCDTRWLVTWPALPLDDALIGGADRN